MYSKYIGIIVVPIEFNLIFEVSRPMLQYIRNIIPPNYLSKLRYTSIRNPTKKKEVIVDHGKLLKVINCRLR